MRAALEVPGTSPISAPIFCVGVGVLAGPVLGLVEVSTTSEHLVLLLEAALVMVLFADASGLDVAAGRASPCSRAVCWALACR